MRLLLFALLVVGGTLFAGAEKLEECLGLIDPEELQERALQADEDGLEVLCEPVLQLFNCVDRAVKDTTNMSIETLASIIDQEELKRGLTLYLNIRKLTKDICAEDTELHRAYVENAPCYSRVQEEDKCMADARAAYSAYQSFREAANEIGDRRKRRDADDDDDDDDEDDDEDVNCMVQAYFLACLSGEILDQCGERAHSTFLRIVKESTVLKYGLCSPEDAQELKTSFLDSLELEADRRSLFARAFDIKRRK